MRRSVDGPAGSRLARPGRVILPRRSTAKTQMASRRWDDWPSGETRFGFSIVRFSLPFDVDDSVDAVTNVGSSGNRDHQGVVAFGANVGHERH